MLTIFFDLDGVLIDGFHSDPARRVRWDTTLKEDLGIDPDDLVSVFFQGSFLDVIVGKRDCLESLNEILPDISDGSVSAETLLEYWLRKDSKINTNVFDIIKKLSDHPEVSLYIATNQEHYRARYLWEDLEFRNYFKDIYYSARLGCLKSNPAYFQAINQELGLTGQKVLFFDDTRRNIEVAETEGWDGVVFQDVHDLAQHPDIWPLMMTPALEK
ncbi:MAG: HAD-IA family hydrolase [Rhodospirillales bacterium]|nr:HAD-IA family hydrolase [Rhodospirillales bacterium]